VSGIEGQFLFSFWFGKYNPP